jgi:hypothetical protein
VRPDIYGEIQGEAGVAGVRALGHSGGLSPSKVKGFADTYCAMLNGEWGMGNAHCPILALINFVTGGYPVFVQNLK